MTLTEREKVKDAAVVSFMYTLMIMSVVLILAAMVLHLLGVDFTQVSVQNVLQGIAFVSVFIMLLIYNQIRKM